MVRASFLRTEKRHCKPWLLNSAAVSHDVIQRVRTANGPAEYLSLCACTLFFFTASLRLDSVSAGMVQRFKQRTLRGWIRVTRPAPHTSISVYLSANDCLAIKQTHTHKLVICIFPRRVCSCCLIPSVSFLSFSRILIMNRAFENHYVNHSQRSDQRSTHGDAVPGIQWKVGGEVACKIDETTMKVTESMGERTSAFKLAHQMYQRAGLTGQNDMQMRVMKHHLLDTTDVMVAKRAASIEFTVSLVRDGELGMPADALFGNEIQSMRSAGLRLAEVSCVAGCCEGSNKKQRVQTLVSMIGLTIQVARRRGVDRLLLAVHPRHARIYRRMFGCVACTDVREYDAVEGNPAVLCMHDFRELDQRRYSLYDQVYGANYSPWELDGTRMTDAEKRFFSRAVTDNASMSLPLAA